MNICILSLMHTTILNAFKYFYVISSQYFIFFNFTFQFKQCFSNRCFQTEHEPPVVGNLVLVVMREI
jgi:hypothetical protein